MVGELVMTQHHCEGKEVVQDGVGMAAYTMDSHNCDRLVVDGMVKNEGEPGGGPFWVRGRDGGASLQIVEKTQVDLGSPGQRAIWEAATHFNPVDLVCALRDFEGRPFPLRRWVDPDAAIISRKSWNGRPLLALELPGLWNGAMAGWLTVFVEVPKHTFNPVKSVLDLLRPEHQPG